MPADALTISASGQYVIPSPYGRQRPRRIVAPSSAVDELARRAGSCRRRLAEDGDEVRAPVAHGARERVLEQLQLVRRGRRTAPSGDRAPRGRSEAMARHVQSGSARPRLDRAGVLDLDRPA